jgi:hypothetical protein
MRWLGYRMLLPVSKPVDLGLSFVGLAVTSQVDVTWESLATLKVNHKIEKTSKMIITIVNDEG